MQRKGKACKPQRSEVELSKGGDGLQEKCLQGQLATPNTHGSWQQIMLREGIILNCILVWKASDVTQM